jgi:hypothetical protein
MALWPVRSLVFRVRPLLHDFRRARLRPDLVRDHPQHLSMVGIAHQSAAAQLAFPLGVLGGKNMALERLTALDLARGSFFEALGCAFMGLQFRHKSDLQTLQGPLQSCAGSFRLPIT